MTALSLLGVAVAFIVGLVQTALLHEQGRWSMSTVQKTIILVHNNPILGWCRSDFGPRLRTTPGGSRRSPFVASPPGLGRKRRSITWSELPGLLDLEHGFTFLQVPSSPFELPPSCRWRAPAAGGSWCVSFTPSCCPVQPGWGLWPEWSLGGSH